MKEMGIVGENRTRRRSGARAWRLHRDVSAVNLKAVRFVLQFRVRV